MLRTVFVCGGEAHMKGSSSEFFSFYFLSLTTEGQQLSCVLSHWFRAVLVA